MFEWEIMFDLWHKKVEKRAYDVKFWFHCDSPTTAVNELLDNFKDGKQSVRRIDYIKKLREVK